MAENVLAMLKEGVGGGGNKCWGISYTGGCNKFPSFERGTHKFCSVLREGECKQFWTGGFPILYPPLPVINDRSLNTPW